LDKENKHVQESMTQHQQLVDLVMTAVEGTADLAQEMTTGQTPKRRPIQ
jgi:hypothetical protein